MELYPVQQLMLVVMSGTSLQTDLILPCKHQLGSLPLKHIKLSNSLRLVMIDRNQSEIPESFLTIFSKSLKTPKAFRLH